MRSASKVGYVIQDLRVICRGNISAVLIVHWLQSQVYNKRIPGHLCHAFDTRHAAKRNSHEKRDVLRGNFKIQLNQHEELHDYLQIAAMNIRLVV